MPNKETEKDTKKEVKTNTVTEVKKEAVKDTTTEVKKDITDDTTDTSTVVKKEDAVTKVKKDTVVEVKKEVINDTASTQIETKPTPVIESTTPDKYTIVNTNDYQVTVDIKGKGDSKDTLVIGAGSSITITTEYKELNKVVAEEYDNTVHVIKL